MGGWGYDLCSIWSHHRALWDLQANKHSISPPPSPATNPEPRVHLVFSPRRPYHTSTIREMCPPSVLLPIITETSAGQKPRSTGRHSDEFLTRPIMIVYERGSGSTVTLTHTSCSSVTMHRDVTSMWTTRHELVYQT